MKQLSKRDKELWNEAIRCATRELKNWDGLIPDKGDRDFAAKSIYDKLAYKIKHREYF